MTSRLFSLLQRWKAISLSITPVFGRSIVATAPFLQNQVVLEEWPITSAASPAHRDAVCTQCLQPVNAQQSRNLQIAQQRFCSSECRTSEQNALGDTTFEALGDFCSASGEKFPLMAARLAAAHVHSGIEQPLLDMESLAKARLNRSPPHWLQIHSLMLDGLSARVDKLPAGPRAEAMARLQRLDADWTVGILARLHINTIRVDCIFPPKPGQSFAEMAEAVLSGCSESFSGSACYLLCSMFNHSCEPNVEMSWPANNTKVQVRALRQIDRGEELTITYIDPNLPVKTRQNKLQFGYGFRCTCDLCTYESEATS